jgi:CheY-like chemotaxis protein
MYTPTGGSVLVFLGRVAAHVEIVVSDTGPGIKPEFLPFVFDRFRQADGSITRRHGGLGIGLTIVKNIVEAHGGSVKAASPGEGEGATFTVLLPLPDRTNAPVQRAATTDAGKVAPLHHGLLDGVRVLIVDDEVDARDLVRRLLENHKASAALAGSAEEALRQIEQHRPDVLLSDIGMPGTDGYDLIRSVRQLPPERGGQTPAAAFTALAGAADREKALRAGYQSHIAKPVNAVELLTVVAVLAGREPAQV